MHSGELSSPDLRVAIHLSAPLWAGMHSCNEGLHADDAASQDILHMIIMPALDASPLCSSLLPVLHLCNPELWLWCS